MLDNNILSLWILCEVIVVEGRGGRVSLFGRFVAAIRFSNSIFGCVFEKKNPFGNSTLSGFFDKSDPF
jgi:hypothetical protein